MIGLLGLGGYFVLGMLCVLWSRSSGEFRDSREPLFEAIMTTSLWPLYVIFRVQGGLSRLTASLERWLTK